MSDIEDWQAQKEADLAQKAGLNDQTEEFEFSDEEVMGLEEPEEDDETNWGGSKANYYGGADDQGEESAQEDEEEEALKLQERMAKEMSEQDFYDSDDAEGWQKDAEQGAEDLEVALDPSKMDESDRLQLLQDSYPEVFLLAKELDKCKQSQQQLLEEEASDVVEIKMTALNSYMAMIYSYYALFTSQAQQGSIDIKEHPVMEGILKARELWNLARRLGEESIMTSSEESEAEGEEMSEIEEDGGPTAADFANIDVGSDLDSIMSGAELSEGEGESEGEFDEELSEGESGSEDEFTINVPKAKAAKKTSTKYADFNEAADSIEQQARAKNKQSLRFYTSAIDKQHAPRQDKFAGDLDLPYAERAFERRKRLQEEARLRGLEKKDKLGESDDEQESAAPAPRDEFYASVKQSANDKKAHRQQLHKDAKQAAKDGRIKQYLAENPEEGAKRAIGFQIQKNKGLTPKRNKINRNARVKKRVRYEDAKKRLKGMRREYKPPTGAYSGEASGIRKNVVHSRKF